MQEEHIVEPTRRRNRGWPRKLGFQNFGDLASTSSKHPKPVIIMDEVDGMSAGDRGGVADLIVSIQISKIPIIRICNDRYSQKLKSLVNYCLLLSFRKPTKQQMAKRLLQVANAEGLQVNELESICEDAAVADRGHNPHDNFVPALRSGEWSDIGGRLDMEDTHVCIPDFAKNFGYNLRGEEAISFYGVENEREKLLQAE